MEALTARADAGARPAAVRTPRRALHGVLLLDKPSGWTSQDAVAKCKGITRAEKVGHTGTLDPLATGLLPLCFGAATKFSQAGLDADKRYRATLRLGQRTASGDAETPVLQERPVELDACRLEAALAHFRGPQQQLPPMHSALKHEGRALYTYARAGQAVDRAPRAVVVHRLEVVSRDGDVLVLDVTCSKGTYIRSLADDLGEHLGCGAHLLALQRTGSGVLDLQQAIALADWQALEDGARLQRLLSPEVLLLDLPRVTLAADDAARFLCGARRRLDAAGPDTPPQDARVCVFGPALPGHARPALLGTAHVSGGELVPTRLLSPPEVSACAELPTLPSPAWRLPGGRSSPAPRQHVSSPHPTADAAVTAATDTP